MQITEITVEVPNPGSYRDFRKAANPVLAAIAEALGEPVRAEMTPPGWGMTLCTESGSAELSLEVADAIRRSEQGFPPKLSSFTLTLYPWR